MASGPLPAGGTVTGLKLFVYAISQPITPHFGGSEVSFLAQIVQTNERKELFITIKTDLSDDDNDIIPNLKDTVCKQFIHLILLSLSNFMPMPTVLH